MFHGQVQSTICLCEIAGKPPQEQLNLGFIKDPQKSHRCWVQFKEGIFCSIHSPPRDYTFQTLRTQPLQYTVYITEQPLQSGVSHSVPLLLPVRTCQTPTCARPTWPQGHKKPNCQRLPHDFAETACPTVCLLPE